MQSHMLPLLVWLLVPDGLMSISETSVDVRGQRRMVSLLQADSKASITQIS